jgi:hypothetical protein
MGCHLDGERAGEGEDEGKAWACCADSGLHGVCCAECWRWAQYWIWFSSREVGALGRG